MELVRTAYVRGIEEYRLVIDEKYLSELNTYFNEQCVSVFKPEITEQMIADTMNYDTDNEILNQTFDFNGYQDVFHETLIDWLKEVVDEDLWCSDSELVELSTEDYETAIV